MGQYVSASGYHRSTSYLFCLIRRVLVVKRQAHSSTGHSMEPLETSVLCSFPLAIWILEISASSTEIVHSKQFWLVAARNKVFQWRLLLILVLCSCTEPHFYLFSNVLPFDFSTSSTGMHITSHRKCQLVMFVNFRCWNPFEISTSLLFFSPILPLLASFQLPAQCTLVRQKLCFLLLFLVRYTYSKAFALSSGGLFCFRSCSASSLCFSLELSLTASRYMIVT